MTVCFIDMGKCFTLGILIRGALTYTLNGSGRHERDEAM